MKKPKSTKGIHLYRDIKGYTHAQILPLLTCTEPIAQAGIRFIIACRTNAYPWANKLTRSGALPPHRKCMCLHCGKKLATDDTVFERGEDLGHILRCTNRSIMKLKREFVNHEFSLYGLISADYMLGTETETKFVRL